jgi:hypothetical protein
VQSTDRLTQKTRDMIASGVILSAIFLFFWKILLPGNNFFIGDIYAQFFPWKDFLRASVQDGAVPFWTPFVFSGMPFAADVQKGAFYPPGIIFLFLNFSAALKIFILAHFAVMGISAYYLLRSFNFKAAPSLMGAFVFLFNTFTLTRVDFISALGSYAFFPLIMLVFNRFLMTKSLIQWALFVMLLSLSFLSGHPPVFIYTLIFIFFFWIFHIFRSREFSLMPGTAIKFLSYLAAGALVFFLFTMPQSGLFFDFIQKTSRAHIDYAEAAAGSMTFSGLLNFLMPGGMNGMQVNPLSEWLPFSTGVLNYFSVTFVFLLALSVFYPKDRLYKFSAVMIIISILLSLGANTPVHSWFYAFLPFFWSLRHPGFAIMLMVIPVSAITAFTVENIRLLTPIQLSLFENLSPFSRMRNYFDARFTNRVLGVFLALVAAFMLLLFNNGPVMKIYGFSPAGLLAFVYGCLFFLGMFFINLALFFFCEKNSITKNFYFSVLALMMFMEFYFFASPLNPVVSSKIYDIRSTGVETAEIVRSGTYKFMHTERSARDRNFSGADVLDAQMKFMSTLPSNTGILYRICDAGGYNPLMLEDYANFIGPIFRGDEVADPEKLNLLNVKYLISSGDVSVRGYEKTYGNGLISVSKSQNTLPMFFVTKSKDRLDLRMAQSSWSRKKENDYGELKITLNTDGDGYFVYANNYYPGWKVYVDNRESVIEKCLGLYLGVKITKGAHDVTLVYVPEHLREFLLLNYLISAVLMILGVIVIVNQSKRYADL